jgi:hypothetical protein
MPNPTGSVYLQANNSYAWADGDVYEIAQTDQQEGAATGASFSGIGVDNQPHQLLLNKIQYTHNKQITDEANIASLQTFQALFASRVGINGYLKIGAQDSNLGQIDIIVQWGTISLIGLSTSPINPLKNGVFSFSFPIAFPHAIWALMPWLQSNNASGAGALVGTMLALETITPLGLASNQIFSDWDNGDNSGPQTAIRVAQSANDGVGLTGIGWLAIGY